VVEIADLQGTTRCDNENYLWITWIHASNPIGSRPYALLAADYFAVGKTDAKSIVGVKTIAER